MEPKVLQASVFEDSLVKGGYRIRVVHASCPGGGEEPGVTTGEVAALFTIGSREDRRQAQPIMDLAEEAFSSIGLTETEAKRAYGKLSRYTYNKDIYADVAAEHHTLELLSADFEYSEGLIWVYYRSALVLP